MFAEQSRNTTCECKIGRGIDQYHLYELNDSLLSYRQANDASLRELASFINRQILQAAIEATSQDILSEENGLFGALESDDAVATVYNVLQNTDAAPDQRARVRTRLRQAGVDLDHVENHWVTHTTTRQHLQKCLGVDTRSETTIEIDNATDTIEWIRTRCIAIVERTLERLHSADKLECKSIDVSVSIRVTCTECGKTYNPNELVSQGRCECYPKPSQE